MLGYYILAGLFATYVLEPEQEDIGDTLGVGDETLLVSILAVVLIAGLAPIAEELFFRGFFFGGLRKRFPLWAAAILAGHRVRRDPRPDRDHDGRPAVAPRRRVLPALREDAGRCGPA